MMYHGGMTEFLFLVPVVLIGLYLVWIIKSSNKQCMFKGHPAVRFIVRHRVWGEYGWASEGGYTSAKIAGFVPVYVTSEGVWMGESEKRLLPFAGIGALIASTKPEAGGLLPRYHEIRLDPKQGQPHVLGFLSASDAESFVKMLHERGIVAKQGDPRLAPAEKVSA